jgi:DNA invertase Pin-like site-specific DNA recombinase
MAKATGMKIGYARVSTDDQNLDLQRDALKRAGCKKIIEDTARGGKVRRVGLERVREQLRKGDVLAVWRLDRLSAG